MNSPPITHVLNGVLRDAWVDHDNCDVLLHGGVEGIEARLAPGSGRPDIQELRTRLREAGAIPDDEATATTKIGAGAAGLRSRPRETQ